MHDLSEIQRKYLQKAFFAEKYEEEDIMFKNMCKSKDPASIINNLLMTYDSNMGNKANQCIIRKLHNIVENPSIIFVDLSFIVHHFALFFLQNRKHEILIALFEKSKNLFFFRTLIYYSISKINSNDLFTEFNKYYEFIQIFSNESLLEVFNDPPMYNPGSFYLEPFLNLFIYDGSSLNRPCNIMMSLNKYTMNTEANRFYERIKYLNTLLHKFLKNIMKNKDIKKLTSDYFVKLIYKNKERLKMQFDDRNAISDGFAFNAYLLLLQFSKPIISKDLSSLINEEYIMNFDFEVIEGNFTSIIFITTFKMVELSFCKFIDSLNELNREMYFLRNRERDERENRLYHVFKSRIYAYRVILNSEFMNDTVKFIEYFIRYINMKNIHYAVPPYYFIIIFKILRFKESLSKNYIHLIGRLMEDKELENEIIQNVILIYDDMQVQIPEKQNNYLIDYYVKIDKQEDALTYKIAIINILCANNIYIRNLCNIKFINIFLTDLEKLLFNGLNDLQELNSSRGDGEGNNLEMKIKNNFLAAKYILDYLLRVVKSSKVLEDRKIFPKLISILNSTLKTMVGPKCTSLNVKDKEKYNFDPRNILRILLNIYIVIKGYRNIYEIMLDDKLFFNILLFKRAEEISKTKKILSDNLFDGFKNFVDILESRAASEQENDSAVQIPDEFIDPLTCDIMSEPVRLKTSNNIIDMSTFETLMMGDMLDPFNREPLKEGDAVIDEEMKKQIMEWREKNKC